MLSFDHTSSRIQSDSLVASPTNQSLALEALSDIAHNSPSSPGATEPLKPTNRFSIASLVFNQSPRAFCSKSSFEEHLKSPFGRQLHMGMGVLPVQDFESRQLVNKLNSTDSRFKAAPILSVENKSDDEDIDDDSMSIKVDEEEKDTYVSDFT